MQRSNHFATQRAASSARDHVQRKDLRHTGRHGRAVHLLHFRCSCVLQMKQEVPLRGVVMRERHCNSATQLSTDLTRHALVAPNRVPHVRLMILVAHFQGHVSTNVSPAAVPSWPAARWLASSILCGHVRRSPDSHEKVCEM